MAGMDFDTALSGLAKGNFTTAELLKFMEGVSGAVEGATANSKYALYSGLLPDGTPAYKTLDKLFDDGTDPFRC